MSTNPNVEKAANAFVKAIDSGLVGAGPPTINHGMDAVDAAGLLVTPLHTRALEACKEMARLWPLPDNVNQWVESRNEAMGIGREAIELEKPKERYVVFVGSIHRPIVGPYAVLFQPDDGFARVFIDGCTEAQARAVAKALNECDAS